MARRRFHKKRKKGQKKEVFEQYCLFQCKLNKAHPFVLHFNSYPDSSSEQHSFLYMEVLSGKWKSKSWPGFTDLFARVIVAFNRSYFYFYLAIKILLGWIMVIYITPFIMYTTLVTILHVSFYKTVLKCL